MRLEDMRESENVEDRTGMGRPAAAFRSAAAASGSAAARSS